MESSFASRYGEIAVCSAFVIAGGVDSEDLKHPPKIGSTDKPRNIERKIVFIFYLCPYVFLNVGELTGRFFLWAGLALWLGLSVDSRNDVSVDLSKPQEIYV
jgi:hypothetical protein